MPAVQDAQVFLRSGTEVSHCFTFPTQPSPCGTYFKAVRGSPSKASWLLQSNHHGVPRGAQRGNRYGLTPRVSRAGSSSESYTKVLRKRLLSPSPAPETLPSVSFLTLKFPSEQRCTHHVQPPQTQPCAGACLMADRHRGGTVHLQGGFPAHPSRSQPNGEGRSWEQREPTRPSKASFAQPQTRFSSQRENLLPSTT